MARHGMFNRAIMTLIGLGLLATAMVAPALAQEAFYAGVTTCVNEAGTVTLAASSYAGGAASVPGNVASSQTLTLTMPGLDAPVVYGAQTLHEVATPEPEFQIAVLAETPVVPPSPGPYGQATWTQSVRLSTTDGGELLPGQLTLDVRWSCSALVAPPIPRAARPAPPPLP